MISRLNDDHGIDPTRFGDLTYPQLVCILSRGQAAKKDTEAARARKIRADFKAGKIKW